MTDQQNISGYRYSNGELNDSHRYLLPALRTELAQIGRKRIFDLGCGNGSVAAAISKDGWDVTGIDASREGITLAQERYPELKLEIGSVYDELAVKYGTFPVVYSLEVVEHLYDPRSFARTLYSLLEPGGTAIVSTPYHGYWKNLVLALTGKMDAHFHALRDHGHIKFWSIATLTQLLREAGLDAPRIELVGRTSPLLSALAKSMIAIVRRPF